MKRALFLTLLFFAAGSMSAARADTLTVTAQSFNFAPSSVIIQLGDTIHWKWVNGSHTVTSGTGGADPNVGVHFNASMSAGSQNFYYTFSDTAGVYPYHCTPHEFLNMKGTITVEAPITVDTPLYNPFKSWSELKQLFQ